MRFPPLRSITGSLRFRLTVMNTLVVLGASLAALIAMREGLRYSLLRETDTLLVEETIELALAIRELHPSRQEIIDEMERKAIGHTARGWIVELIGPDGELVWNSPNTPAAILARRTAGQHDTVVFSDGEFRIAERHVEFANTPHYTVRVGTPTDFITRDVNLLTGWILSIAAVLAILAPLGGYLLALRATRPLRRIIHTTERLRPSQLDERLPIRGTGDELDQLSAKINHFLDLIGAYLERNRQFVGDAAHELRSPLAAIRSSAEVALSKQRTPEEYEELLISINDQCDQLRVLVNQLLVLAESESCAWETPQAPTLLDEIVGQSLAMFEGVAEERAIALRSSIEPGVSVLGAPSRWRQVVNNLIDNALKFTPAGGVVEVSLQQRGEQVVLTVADTGVGISPEDLPRVFDRFYRADKSHQRAGAQAGSGLGLSICQSIVERFGGVIEVESEERHGTLFRVVAPRAASTL